MKGIREALYNSIVTLLAPMDTPVYSYVPSNLGTSFIFIELTENTQLESKGCFYQGGILDIELYTGNSEWQGSILPMVRIVDQIKRLLQPYPAFKPNAEMTDWRLLSDNGFQQLSDTERVYVASLQYEFEWMPEGSAELVYHQGEQVTQTGINIIHYGN